MMTENELREVLGEELFDRLSQDDKEMILNTAGKVDFSVKCENTNKPNSPQAFYVIDKRLGSVVRHPTAKIPSTDLEKDDDIYLMPQFTFFAIDYLGTLLILDGFGEWTRAPKEYTYIVNRDFRNQ